MNPNARSSKTGLQPFAAPTRPLKLVFAFCAFILTFNKTLLYSQAAPGLASQLAVIDNAVPGAPIFKTAEATKQGFANCLKGSIKTEFDTSETFLAKATKTPCRFAGITTFKGRGDSVYGDVLKYDSQKQAIFWSMPMKPLDNLISGRIASPYDLNSKDDTKTLTKEQKSEVKGVSSVSYVLFPLYGDKDTSRVYEGSNAFGAKIQVTEVSGTRYSLAVNVGKQMGFGPQFLIASAPLPREKAEELMPYLDLKLYWVVTRPCGECLFGGTAQMGTIGEPTFDSPYSIKLLHQYVFGSLIAVRIIDRRDGSTVAISSGGH